MPAPPNTTPETAIDIDAVPYSNSQDVFDSGTTHTVWYKLPAVEADGTYSIWGYGGLGTYEPTVFLYRNDPNGASFNSYKNRPVYFPVETGDVIYFKFDQVVGNPNPAVIEVSLTQHINVAAPEGSIGVADTQGRYPIAVLSATVDNTPLQYVPNFTVTGVEYGACILPDGTLALGGGTDVVLCDAQYQNVNFVTHGLSDDVNWIGSNNDDTFYVSTGWPNAGGPAEVTTIAKTGTLGPTVWTLTEENVRGIAPNPAETVLYYIDQDATTPNEPVRRWDLINDVALSDLAAGIDTDTYFTSNILCLSDGSVLVGYRNDTAETQFVRQYSAAGAVVRTFELTWMADTGDQDLLARDVADTSFWYMQHGDSSLNVIPVITRFRVSDGAVLVELEQTQFDAGRYAYDETATPLARFGMPYSCPFWITRSSVEPEPIPPDSDLNGPEGLTILENAGLLRTLDVRRMRRAPHLADEQQRVFYHKFQLDIEAGVGTVTGQGVDPVLMLRVSKDGGFTWNTPRTLGVGRQGQYRYRCIAFQLGMGRDVVFEVTQSDPVKTVWLDAYLDFTEGLV